MNFKKNLEKMVFERKKILIIDDEPDICEFISYNLTHTGYEVFVSHDGKNGYEMAKKTNPDLIILDIMMPELNGFETCSLIKKTPSLKNSILVLFSALSENYTKNTGFELGADYYLCKPIKMKELIVKVNKWIAGDKSVGSQRN
jgi:two-component system, OmpR family, alkaline phosphatase synthesis response regulator PhoP